MSRICPKCQNKFASSNFYAGRTECKDCHKEAVRENQEAKRDFYLAYHRNRQRTLEDWYSLAKAQASGGC